MLRQLIAGTALILISNLGVGTFNTNNQTRVAEYHITQCEGDCNNFGEPDQKPILFTTSSGEKIMAAHGSRTEMLNVPKGYKLLSCFCKQKECIVQTPDDEQFASYKDGVLTFFIKKNLTYTEQELKEIDKRNQEAWENL